MTDWSKTAQWRRPYQPTRKSTSIPTSCPLKVPRNQRDQAIAAELSRQFRAGTLFAYSFDSGQWVTWSTQADWDATERTGPAGRVIRDQAAADAGHGPHVWNTDRLARQLVVDTAHAGRPKRPGKAELVAMLRRIYEGSDWEVTELEALLAAA